MKEENINFIHYCAYLSTDLDLLLVNFDAELDKIKCTFSPKDKTKRAKCAVCGSLMTYEATCDWCGNKVEYK